MGYDVKDLTTVRIMAVNVRGYETYDVLIVATMGGMNLEEHQKIRIFLKKMSATT